MRDVLKSLITGVGDAAAAMTSDGREVRTDRGSPLPIMELGSGITTSRVWGLRSVVQIQVWVIQRSRKGNTYWGLARISGKKED